MKTILYEDTLLFALCICGWDLLKCCLHVIWSTQFELPQNLMQLWVRDEALRAWMGGSSSAAPAEIRSLFSILWCNQNARVENSTDIVSTAMNVTVMWTMFHWFEYNFQNFLINISLEMSKFFRLGRWATWRIRMINDLCNGVSYTKQAMKLLPTLTMGIYPTRIPPPFPDVFLIWRGSHAGRRTIGYLHTRRVTRPLSSQKCRGR
jgi:hypothetical protein